MDGPFDNRRLSSQEINLSVWGAVEEEDVFTLDSAFKSSLQNLLEGSRRLDFNLEGKEGQCKMSWASRGF